MIVLISFNTVLDFQFVRSRLYRLYVIRLIFLSTGAYFTSLHLLSFSKSIFMKYAYGDSSLEGKWEAINL